jgi:hypothetical protein
MIADIETERMNLLALRAGIAANMGQLVETLNAASEHLDKAVAAQIRACRQAQMLIDFAKGGEVRGDMRDLDTPRVTDAQLLMQAHNVVPLRPGMTARSNGAD